jgi:acetoin utilization deacetylase AcuC-like enzyme
MKNLAVVFSDKHEMHFPDFVHAENPERVKSIFKFLNDKNFFKDVDLIEPGLAAEENITAVHTKEYFYQVKSSIESGDKMLDPDTYITKNSFEAALLSAGSAVKATDLAMSKEYKYTFSLMRPPGHHAESNKAMGFCLFNNAAIAAKHALDNYGISKAAIVDWDVHHGNGTQEIFYSSKEVLFISLHQYPFYPGTGSSSEEGSGEGKNFTMNFPLNAGTNGEAYIKIFQEKIIPALNNFDPELLIISAGFDAHKDDPLANMNLVEKDFEQMTSILKEFAGNKNIPLVSILEGGYNLNALPASVYRHLMMLNKV